MRHLTEQEKIELQELERENFENWVSTWRFKQFDLTKPKQELLWDVYRRFVNGEILSADILSKVIFSTYFYSDRNFSYQFEDDANLRFKNVGKLYAKFVEDVTDEKCERLTFEQLIDKLATHTFNLLTEVFGNAIYLDFKPLNTRNAFKNSLIQNLCENGFKNCVQDANLFVNPQRPYSIVASQHQQWVKDFYINSLKDYVSKFSALKLKINPDEFEEICKNLAFFLDEAKKRMTKETLNDIQVQEAMKKEEELFRSSLLDKKSKLEKVKYGEYYLSISEIIQKLNLGKADKNDKKVFEDFIERCKLLKQAMSIVDKNGEPYRTNYFVIMPMNTKIFCLLLNRAEKCQALDKNTREFFSSVKLHLSRLFPHTNAREVSETVDLNNTLNDYKKLRAKTKDSEIDLNDENVFIDFKQTAEQIIQKYNLPKTKECIISIGNDLFRGRKPINLGELDPTKTAKVK